MSNQPNAVINDLHSALLPAADNQTPLPCSAGVDVTEAPSGYYPILKAVAAPKDGSNICRACDWRKTCQDPATDFNTRGHRCMSYSRYDGHGVLFKSLPNDKGQLRREEKAWIPDLDLDRTPSIRGEGF